MWFGPRDYLETDSSFKQIIPYVIVRQWDIIWVYTRAQSWGESRLFNRLSIGFWGHVSVSDSILDGEILNVEGTLVNSLRRELFEELGIEKSYPVERIGYIYDPSNDVGKVHLGVVYVIEIEASDVGGIEEHIAQFRFVSLDTISGLEGEFETWSQLLLEHLKIAWK
jgi:predicted NUDIX family phosphoesterase